MPLRGRWSWVGKKKHDEANSAKDFLRKERRVPQGYYCARHKNTQRNDETNSNHKTVHSIPAKTLRLGNTEQFRKQLLHFWLGRGERITFPRIQQKLGFNKQFQR